MPSASQAVGNFSSFLCVSKLGCHPPPTTTLCQVEAALSLVGPEEHMELGEKGT